MKLVAALLGAALLLTAAPAAGETAAPSPPQVVKSKDGGLTVSVPRGALRKPAKLRIRVLTPRQYPPELKGVTFRPGSKLYALEPDGQRFLKPVTITRRINVKVSGFDLDAGVPGILLLARSTGGTWEILKGQRVSVAGETLVITGTTRHFSTEVAFDGGARLTLIPSRVDTFVGATWDAAVKAEIDNRRRSDPVSVESIGWAAEPVVAEQSDRGRQGATFTCTKPGKGRYYAEIEMEEESLALRVASGGFLNIKVPVYTEDFYLFGRAVCNAPPPTVAELTLACVLVAHSPLGPFPSFTRWLLQFLKSTLPPNARAELTASGVNNGQPVSAPVDAATGKVELQGGISSFGSKAIQKLTVNGQDVTQQLVGKVGAAPTVTASQGVIAGQCPP